MNSKINLFIRSLLFSIIMASSTFIYSFFCLLSFALPLNFRFKMIAGFTGFNIWWAKILCGIHYRIEGLENIPKDRNGIILCKHQSTWETFFLPTLFPKITIIVKRELLWVPFFGWGLATIKPIAINRKNNSSAMNQIFEKGQKSLDLGRWILIFPEGTRMAPGEVGHYRLGGARLATHTGYPILPIAHNAGSFWPKRRFFKRPGTVTVVIGPMIESKGRTPEALIEETKNWIETTMRNLPSPKS